MPLHDPGHSCRVRRLPCKEELPPVLLAKEASPHVGANTHARVIIYHLSSFVAVPLPPPLLQVARLVPDYVRSLVAAVAPHAQQVVAAFGIPDALVAAPIALNWEAYNSYDNQGELPCSPFGGSTAGRQ